jgi:hypothetical protein
MVERTMAPLDSTYGVTSNTPGFRIGFWLRKDSSIIGKSSNRAEETS